MNTADFLGTYAEGWTNGNSDTILSATSDSFVFDDPNAGKVAKEEFQEFFAGLKEAVASIRGAGHEGHRNRRGSESQQDHSYHGLGESETFSIVTIRYHNLISRMKLIVTCVELAG